MPERDVNYTFEHVKDNLVAALEMLGGATEGRVANLRGPTREENLQALSALLREDKVFIQDDKYYLTALGLNDFMKLTGGIRLSGPMDKSGPSMS